MNQTQPKAHPFTRIMAKGVDLLVFAAVAAVLPSFIGPLLGFVYSVVGDGLSVGPFVGQSVGKKLFGLQTVSVERGEPISIKESLIRNAPVGLATFFALIPIWGWAILILVGVPLVAIEIYLMMVKNGMRLGDVMADTEVIRLERSALRTTTTKVNTTKKALRESD